MSSLADFWLSNWQYLVTSLILVIGGSWTLYTYRDRKKDELAWRRTEFLFEQARYVETDPDISSTIRLLEGRDTISVGELLTDSTSDNPDRLSRLHSLDKTLNIFDRFAYAVYTSETLTIDELRVFAWYLEQIADDPALRQYCRDFGYGDVLRLSEDVSPSPTTRIESRDPSGK